MLKAQNSILCDTELLKPDLPRDFRELNFQVSFYEIKLCRCMRFLC